MTTVASMGHHPEVIKAYRRDFAGGVVPLSDSAKAKIESWEASGRERSSPRAEDIEHKLRSAQERAEAEIESRKNAAASATRRVEDAATRRAEAAMQVSIRLVAFPE